MCSIISVGRRLSRRSFFSCERHLCAGYNYFAPLTTNLHARYVHSCISARAGPAMPSLFGLGGIAAELVFYWELLHLSSLLPGFAFRDVIFCFPSLFTSLL